MIIRSLAASAAIAIVASVPAPAWAQDRTYAFDIPAGDLGAGIRAFAKESRQQVSFDGALVAGKRGNEVKGSYVPDQALARLLERTGVAFRKADRGVFVLSAEGNAGAVGETAASKREVPAATSAAQDQAAQQAIVVTGTHIHGASAEGPSSVIVLTRQDLERSGRATVAEALAQLPQNFASPVTPGLTSSGAQGVNLRGLGEDNTLVLVNGRRVAPSGASGNAPFVDLNSIPLAAVERIEVLPDGASAIYGSDAVTGVVNIILKKNFTGSEVSLHSAVTQDGGASEIQPSFVTGWAKGGFNILLSGEYFKRTALAASDRSFSSTDDLRARGGGDHRSTITNPGNVFSLSGSNLPGLNATFAGIPAGQDGRNLTPADFVATAGNLNLQSTIANSRDLIPASERYGLNLNVNGSVMPWLSVYFEAGLSHNKTTNPLNSPSFLVTVPASNAFNPFGQPVQVRWFASGISAGTTEDSENRRVVLGFKGRVGKWQSDTSFSYSRDRFDNLSFGQPIAGPALSQLLASSDPNSALNVFGDGPTANTPQVLARLGFGRQTIAGVSDIAAANGSIDGPLLDWGGGRTLNMAAGWEYRRETFKSLLSTFQTDPNTPNITNSVAGARNVLAGFLELDQSLFGPGNELPGLQKLDLQLALRTEHYSDFGNTTNPKIAVLWKPVSSLALRGSLGTSFRAPSLRELFGAVTPFHQGVIDPRRNNESLLVPTDLGGNPRLQPERSRNWNLGMVWDVPFVPGLSLSASYWDLRQRQRITSITASQLLAAESLFPTRVVRAAPTAADIAAGLPGHLTFLDLTSLNVAFVRLRGADFELRDRFDTGFGKFDLRFAGARVFSARQQLTPVTPVQELAGTLAGSNIGEETDRPEVKFRANFSLFWSRDAWSAGVTERYTGPTRDPFSALHPLINHHYETDLQIDYAWRNREGVLAGMRLSASVVNLFNSKPPFRDFFFGFPSALYDPRGAVYQMRVTKAF
jgi:iron complex outermembrane recepter protein